MKGRIIGLNRMAFNIAHITLTMKDGGGGLENLIVNLSRATDSGLFSITIGCLDYGGSLLKHIHEMGCESFVVGRYPGFDWGLIIKLAKIFSKRKFHIVHSHNQAAHFYAGIAAKLARIPVVIITEHSRHNTAMLLRRKIEKRILYGISDKWVVVSDELARQSINKDGLSHKKIKIIRNGVEFDHYNNDCDQGIQQAKNLKLRIGVPEDAKIIVMVARLHPIKNHKLFIDAFYRRHKSLKDVHVLFVGDGECREDLILQAKQLNLESKIHFLGFREDVSALLGISDVFVLCSKTEGLPVSLLEACAAEVPVVISRPSNKAGLIRHQYNGIEVENDAEALADALVNILNNPKKARAMAVKSSQQVKKEFSLSTMAKQYEDLYLKILAKKGFNI